MTYGITKGCQCSEVKRVITAAIKVSAQEVGCVQIYLVIYCTPVGIASLIAQTILRACNITQLLKSLGLYVGTILIGFALHGFVLLPLTLLALTWKNPFGIMR